MPVPAFAPSPPLPSLPFSYDQPAWTSFLVSSRTKERTHTTSMFLCLPRCDMIVLFLRGKSCPLSSRLCFLDLSDRRAIDSDAKLSPDCSLPHHNADYETNNCADHVEQKCSQDTGHWPRLPRAIPVQRDHNGTQPCSKDRHHPLTIQCCLRESLWAIGAIYVSQYPA